MSVSHNACEEAQEQRKLERGVSQVGDAASQIAKVGEAASQVGEAASQVGDAASQVGDAASQVGDAAIHCARGSCAGPRWRVGPTIENSIVGLVGNIYF